MLRRVDERASRISIYTDDFGQLARYREADRALAPATGEKRVVFLGDSITEYWKLPNYFPGKPYINRGVDGQTTPEMLVRFRQDVIHLHPKVVVILAGTNEWRRRFRRRLWKTEAAKLHAAISAWSPEKSRAAIAKG